MIHKNLVLCSAVLVVLTLSSFAHAAGSPPPRPTVPTFVGYGKANGLVRFQANNDFKILSKLSNPIAKAFPNGVGVGLAAANGSVYLLVQLNPEAPSASPSLAFMAFDTRFNSKGQTPSFSIPSRNNRTAWDFAIASDSKSAVFWSTAQTGSAPSMTLVDLATGKTNTKTLTTTDKLVFQASNQHAFDSKSDTLYLLAGPAANPNTHAYYAFGLDGNSLSTSIAVNSQRTAGPEPFFPKFSPRDRAFIGSKDACLSLADPNRSTTFLWCDPDSAAFVQGRAFSYTNKADVFLAASSALSQRLTKYIRLDFNSKMSSGPIPVATFETINPLLNSLSYLAGVASTPA